MDRFAHWWKNMEARIGKWSRKGCRVELANSAEKGTYLLLCVRSIHFWLIYNKILARWVNHLDPFVSKSTWTEHEDRFILQRQEQIGNKWAEISRDLPGRYVDLSSFNRTDKHNKLIRYRTDNAIKNHWNSSIKPRLSKYLTFLEKQKSSEKQLSTQCIPSQTLPNHHCLGARAAVEQTQIMGNSAAPYPPPVDIEEFLKVELKTAMSGYFIALNCWMVPVCTLLTYFFSLPAFIQSGGPDIQRNIKSPNHQDLQ